MRYALIKNNLVENVIVAEPDFLSLIRPHFDHIVEVTNEPGSPGIGWSYNGTNFIPPAPEAA